MIGTITLSLVFKQSMGFGLKIVIYNNKLYDYLKQNQSKANEIRAIRLAKTHDPLALCSKTPTLAPYALIANTLQQPQYPSPVCTPEQPLPLNNNQLWTPSLMISSNTRNKQIAQPGMNMNQGRQMLMVDVNVGNQGNRQTCVGHYARNHTNKARVRDSTYYIERLMLVQQEEVGIALTPTSSNTDTALIYYTDGISEVLNFDNYYDNEIYNLLAHEEQHFELLESIQGPYVEQKYDSKIMAGTTDVDFSRGEVEQHVMNNEETDAYFESLVNNFKVELDRCVMVNRDAKAEIKRLTTELE
ncbi:hypothetical protein Tco_1040424 [Tanacetum coccineum]